MAISIWLLQTRQRLEHTSDRKVRSIVYNVHVKPCMCTVFSVHTSGACIWRKCCVQSGDTIAFCSCTWFFECFSFGIVFSSVAVVLCLFMPMSRDSFVHNNSQRFGSRCGAVGHSNRSIALYKNDVINKFYLFGAAMSARPFFNFRTKFMIP